MNYGLKIKQLRESAGISQNMLAEMTGISRQALAYFEDRGGTPTWITVQRIVKALDVDYTDLEDPELSIPGRREPKRRGRPPKETSGKEPP